MPTDQRSTRFPFARVAFALSLAILVVATPSMASFFQGGGDASTDGASASITWSNPQREESRQGEKAKPQGTPTTPASESEPCCPAPDDQCCQPPPSEPCCTPPPGEPCCTPPPSEPCCPPPSEPCCPTPPPEPCCSTPPPEPCCSTSPTPCCDTAPRMFSAVVSPHRIGVERGQSVQLQLEIYNHARETIRVNLAKIATEKGWDASLGASEVRISSGSSFALPVKLVAPYNGTVEGWALVRLVANGARETTQYVTAQGFIIPPKPAHSVAVEVNPKSVDMRAGETVEIRYDVRNTGTQSDAYKIGLRAPPGFKIDASHTGMLLGPGEQLTGIAHLTATRNATSGLLEVFVTGESGATARTAARINVYAEPEPIRSVRLYLEGGNETNPGNTSTFFVRAQNDARTNRTVDLRPGAMPDGWTIRFEPARLYMPGGHMAVARAYVSVPECARAGDYFISVDGYVLEENSRVNAWAKVRVVNERPCATA